uniref:DUF4939 domain-containing protein n=1 Tax=Sinocyclocheilus rhinocerous TaxID=307959 RepID=A0A673JKH8_9TELE
MSANHLNHQPQLTPDHAHLNRTLTVTSMDPRPPTEVLEELVNVLRTTLMPALMAMPPSYAGDAAECGGFLIQVVLFIEMQPQKFTTERTKVIFLISLLAGRELMWAKAIWNANSLIIIIIISYEAFTKHFKEVFGNSNGPGESKKPLRSGSVPSQ